MKESSSWGAVGGGGGGCWGGDAQPLAAELWSPVLGPEQVHGAGAGGSPLLWPADVAAETLHVRAGRAEVASAVRSTERARMRGALREVLRAATADSGVAEEQLSLLASLEAEQYMPHAHPLPPSQENSPREVRSFLCSRQKNTACPRASAAVLPKTGAFACGTAVRLFSCSRQPA